MMSRILALTIVSQMVFVLPIAGDATHLPKMVLLAAGVLVMALWPRPGILVQEDPLWLPIGLMLGMTALSASGAQGLELQLHGPYSTPSGALLGFGLVAAAYYVALDSEADPETVGKAFTFAGVVMGICSLVGPSSFTMTGMGRAASTMGSPPVAGCMMALALPIVAYRRKESDWAKAAEGLLLIGLLVTYSRSAWLGAAAGYIVMGLARGSRLAWILSAPIAVAVVLMGGKTYSDSMRFETWTVALEVFKSSPVFGVGPGGFYDAFRQFITPAWIGASDGGLKIAFNHAHNDLLQVLATLGAVGLVAYLFLTLAVFSELRRRVTPYSSAVMGSFAAVFVYAKFNPVPIQALALLAILLGVALIRPRVRWNDGAALGPSSRRWLCAAAAAIALAMTSEMLRADLWYGYARSAFMAGYNTRGLEALREANRRRPSESFYAADLMDSLFTMARMSNDPLPLLAEAAAVGARSIEIRPNDATAHEAYAQVLIVMAIHQIPRRRAGLMDLPLRRAQLAVDQALELLPVSQRLLHAKMHLLYHFGADEVAIAAVGRRYAKILTMLGQPAVLSVRCTFCPLRWKDH